MCATLVERKIGEVRPCELQDVKHDEHGRALRRGSGCVLPCNCQSMLQSAKVWTASLIGNHNLAVEQGAERQRHARAHELGKPSREIAAVPTEESNRLVARSPQ